MKRNDAHTRLGTVPESNILPFRYFGMGFYLAWIYSVQFGSALFPGSVSAQASDMAFVIENLSNAVCLIAVALFAQRIQTLANRRALPWIAAALMTTGTLVTAFTGMLGNTTTGTLVIGSVMSGLGLGFIILLWSEFFAHLPTRQVSVFYSSSFILAVVLHMIIVNLTPAFGLAFTALLPFLSVIMFALSTTDKNFAFSSGEAPEPLARRWSFPWRPVILMAVYSFAFNFGRTTGGSVSDWNMIGVAVIAIAVLIGNLFFFEKFDTRVLWRVALPLMVAGLLLQPFLPGEAQLLAGICLNASHAGFVILTMVVLSNICFRYGVNPLWLFGLTRAGRVLASVLGAQTGIGISAISTSGTVLLITVIVVIALVTLSMIFLNEHDLASTWGITPIKAEVGVSMSNYYETFAGRCAEIARMYGLTHREEEVLALLAQGKGVPRIEQELIVSNNTAKSHVRHIYTKLAIHSRDELISLVGMDKASAVRVEGNKEDV